MAIQDHFARVDVADELRNVFLVHGALSVDTAVFAPKPAPASSFCLLELRRLHTPAVKALAGLDLSAACMDAAAVPVRELEACLSAVDSSDALALSYARSVSRVCELLFLFTTCVMDCCACGCSVLDASGVVVQLPFDLCEQHARFVARHGIQRLKRCLAQK